MGGTTPRLALPYPVAADTADVPRDVKALADKLDTYRLNVPLVTALPGSPLDGDEVYFQVNSSTVWRLRYDASRAAAQPWVFLGGNRLENYVGTSEATASTTYTALATVGPSLDIPISGVYDIEVGALITTANVAGNQALMGPSINAANVNDLTSASMQTQTAAPVAATVDRVWVNQVVAGVNALVVKYRSSAPAGTVTFARRYLRATPVVVG